MNSTSARCVIAHSDRLKRFMMSLPAVVDLSGGGAFDGADAQARFELLDAKRDDAVAVVDARGDQRRIAGERRQP